MGRLIVTEFATLDGVAQSPGAPDEDRSGGFAHGGWQAPFGDAVAGSAMFDQASRMDGLLLGRKTYELFAGYWPHASDEIPFKRLLNDVPKFVASSTLPGQLAWDNSTLIGGDLGADVAALKQRLDEVHVIGSLDLLQTLLALGLVDEMRLWIYPLVLGTGKRVFAGGVTPTAMQMRSCTPYDSGVVQLVYSPADTPEYGRM